MIKLNEYRLLVLERDGNWEKYEKEIGVLHKDCLEKYCELKKLNKNLTISEIIRATLSIIIYNISDDVVAFYLPESLSEEQLYQLELFTEFSLDEIRILGAEKISEEKQVFQLEDNIKERFSSEVIQSYYNTSQKIK